MMGLIFNRQTQLSSDVHPALAFCLIWIAVMWLSMVEGGQASLVGLAPVRRELYMSSHPLAYKCSMVTHKGDNLDRYLLGRQFMVVFIVFVVNLCGAPLAGAELWGLPRVLLDIFLVSSIGMVLFTCIIGQLTSQVNAGTCMLDYINNFFALFTLWVALLVESSGLLHASYLVQKMVSKVAGKSIESYEEERTRRQVIIFYLKCTLSLTILGFSLAVTLEALLKGQTTIWKGAPDWVSIVVFFVLMSTVGLLEGMQIAFFAVAKLPDSERGDATFTKKTCELLFRGEGQNLPGFMIGRQLCSVACFFVIARVITPNVQEGEKNIFGVSDGAQAFFNTGILSAILTTILGSISWQLVASAFPIAFLSNPLTYVFLQICLLLESSGIASGSWVLAAMVKRIFGFQRDEVYIGTREERTKKFNRDDSQRLHAGFGHPVKLPGFIEAGPKSLQRLAKADPSVLTFINRMLPDEQKEEGDTRRMSDVNSDGSHQEHNKDVSNKV